MPQKAVAIAILSQNDQYLLQLRNDKPDIAFPGVWAFFGGHIEPGESPETAMWRELFEEIEYRPPHISHFQTYRHDSHFIRHVYHAPLTVPPETLTLNEGWDLGLFTVDDIHRGERYSACAQQVRPIGAPHRQILLDFLQSRS